MSELNDHINEDGEIHLNPEEHEGARDSSGGGEQSDTNHHRYLHAADPLYQYAITNGLFPDDYAHILESLEASSGRKLMHPDGQAEPLSSDIDPGHTDNGSGIGPDPGIPDEEVPDEQDAPELEHALPQSGEDEEEPASAFVQWLARREKPRALGKSRARVKGKGKKEAKMKPAGKPGGQKVEKHGGPVVDVEAGLTQVKSKKGKRRKDQGIQLSPDVISETLAEVLASQGHIHAAIEMYEKLGLIYPEKKSLFAVKIENLKNT